MAGSLFTKTVRRLVNTGPYVVVAITEQNEE